MLSAPPRLVVLDGYTLNPGDLCWERLLSLGSCSVYDRTPPEKIITESTSAQLVLTNKAVLSREVIEALPALEYIGVMATGTNVVDIKAASEHGITVTNVPIYSTASVAQMVFAHVLNFTQRVSDHSQAVHSGEWSTAQDFCFWQTPQVELARLTMGIVGFGRIGCEVAKLANAFGMQVLVTTRSAVDMPEYAKRVALDDLFSCSDVISLHCPLTPETEGLVDRARLAQMKPTALLINTSRGPLIDEPALAAALERGALAGVGLDVFSTEPPPADHPLLGVGNCVVTPHIAWATRSARKRLLEIVVDNVAAYLAGQPQNVVS